MAPRYMAILPSGKHNETVNYGINSELLTRRINTSPRDHESIATSQRPLHGGYYYRLTLTKYTIKLAHLK